MELIQLLLHNIDPGWAKTFTFLSFTVFLAAHFLVIISVHALKQNCGLSKKVAGISWVVYTFRCFEGIYFGRFDQVSLFQWTAMWLLISIVNFYLIIYTTGDPNDMFDQYPEGMFTVMMIGISIIVGYNYPHQDMVLNGLIMMESVMCIPQYYFNMNMTNILQYQLNKDLTITEVRGPVVRNGPDRSKPITKTTKYYVSMMFIYKVLQVLGTRGRQQYLVLYLICSFIQCGLYVFLLIQEKQLREEAKALMKIKDEIPIVRPVDFQCKSAASCQD